MPSTTKNVAVLGSTGSIGRSALEVIEASAGTLRAVALSAFANVELLIQQARQFRPAYVVAADAEAAGTLCQADLPDECRLLVGPEALEQIAAAPEVDVVLTAIVGSAGLRSTWAALEAGKTIALANKETLVMGGGLVTALAAQRNAPIIPVDSEHSAVYQALQCGRRSDVRRVVLTASGGPFRTLSREQLEAVTIDDALAHPTWRMGRKITIDSATMMNKALEIIEARWLFDLAAEEIGVVVHPQSVIHSLVEYVDGSVVAQLSPPDMKLPIQYALTYPERRPGPAAKFDWTQPHRLEFFPPDMERFPALELGLEAARVGGTAGAVLNAANEAAVAQFLQGEIRYVDVVPACRSVLQNHEFEARPTLERLIECDRWARREMEHWICH
jgi:1-deoxy-D-xylulose-5-phosphate reductoisomerase